MKPSVFIHLEDAAAMRQMQMESIPGFIALLKKSWRLESKICSVVLISEKKAPLHHSSLRPSRGRTYSVPTAALKQTESPSSARSVVRS